MVRCWHSPFYLSCSDRTSKETAISGSCHNAHLGISNIVWIWRLFVYGWIPQVGQALNGHFFSLCAKLCRHTSSYESFCSAVFFFFFSKLGTEPRAFRLIGKQSTTELNPQPLFCLLRSTVASPLWLSVFLSFMWSLDFFLDNLSFWTSIHLSVSVHHVCFLWGVYLAQDDSFYLHSFAHKFLEVIVLITE